MKTFTNTKIKTIKTFKAFFTLAILSLIQLQAFSQAPSDQSTQSPYFVVLSDKPNVDGLPLKSTKAVVNITGVIADVTITQEYKNEGKSALEAIYTFPASTNSAIYAMEMTVGKRKIIAQIEEKNKARQKYEKAKSDGKRASLLEQQRPNVFQMNVANIMPGDLIKVSLKYTEMIIPEDGTYQFVYPTVVGLRYTEKASSNSQFTNTPYTKNGTQPTYDFDIQVNLSTGVPIQEVASSTHQVKSTFPALNTAKVKLDPSEKAGGNRDFVLAYKLAGDQIESGLMLYEHGDENFFMLMVQPPKRIIKEEIPPREYVFIVDVSGSMRGFPIDVSKKLMRNLIVNLRPIDRFNVMLFAGTSGWLAEESLPAVPENLVKATNFIDSQRGGGGTNLLSAMKKAMSLPHCEVGLSRSFIVVTDGYISVEKEVFDMIRNEADEANLFAFGIGGSINRHLIEGMARVGMSEPLIVLNQANADEKAEKFRKYINYPVLTNVKKSFKGFEAYDIEPVAVPDLLAERPLVIYGKYKGNPNGTITLKGQAGGKRYKKTFEVNKTKPNKNHAALRYLWARKKIQTLDDYQLVRNGGEIQKKVTELGLKYNLMTAYTSFLAIEEDITNQGKLQTVKQPLPLPQNVPNTAVGFEMELDEEDIAFSFHKEILVEGFLDVEQEEAIVSKVTDLFITKLNQYLNNHPLSLSTIQITYDLSGKAKTITILGENLSLDQKKEIKQLLLNIHQIQNPSEGLLKISILF